MTVLNGTVRRNGDRLDVNAQLVNARDNSVLWSQTYDREVRDVFAVQEEIVRAIVGALPGRLSLAQGVSRLGRPTSDLEAYELYLKGRHNTWTLPHRERLEQAAVYFHRAAERDPTFAMAHAALAEVYVNLSNFAYLSSGEALARAKVSAAHALELDPELGEAHTAHGYVLASERDFAAAEKAFQRSLALNPNFPWAHHYYSLLLMMLGRTDEALEHNGHALARDPLSLPANATRGIIFTQIGDYASAGRELERALTLGPDYPLTLYFLGAVRAAEGAYSEALPLLQRAAQLAPGFPGMSGGLAFVLLRTGQKAAADSVLARMPREPMDERARARVAFAHAALGQTDTAFAMLAQLKWDVPSLIGLRADPFLRSLRSQSSYRALLRDIGAGSH